MTARRTNARSLQPLPGTALDAVPSFPGPLSPSVRSRSRPLTDIGRERDVDGHEQRGCGEANIVANRIPSSASSSRHDSMSTTGDSTGNVAQFLGDSISHGWSSFQEFATTLLSGGDGKAQSAAKISKVNCRPRSSAWLRFHSSDEGRSHSGKSLVSWGPNPAQRNLRLEQTSNGFASERHALVKVARTASILENHDSACNGLVSTGRLKRRASCENASHPPLDDCLVYIHHVQPDDTFAGLILRYKCREDVFRKSNGLWARDSVQTRQWLAIPVDACEVRGRVCELPSGLSSPGPKILGIASTPQNRLKVVQDERNMGQSNDSMGCKPLHNESNPWTHVTWVEIDSFSQPVQIGRVSRHTLGYFPPRRKKSIPTISSRSTPRHSSDLSTGKSNSLATPPSQRLLGSQSRQGKTLINQLYENDIEDDMNEEPPAWMRRPGGVGSMKGKLRLPGPDGDYLNSWTKKHLPKLNIEEMPSMSIMGSETACFGFTSKAPEIVENLSVDGQNVTSLSQTGTGLDRAAAAVETWLRGAWSKRSTTSVARAKTRVTGAPQEQHGDDLIELANTGEDDNMDLNRALVTTGSFPSSDNQNRGEELNRKILNITMDHSKDV